MSEALSSEITSANPPPPDKINKNVLTAAKGGGYSMVGRIFANVARLAITFILARILGAEGYGLYNLASMTATIAGGLALFGLDTAAVRYIAAFRSQRDEEGIWGTIQITLGLTFVFSIMVAAGLYVLANPIAIELFSEPELAPLLRLSSIFVPLVALNVTFPAVTRGFKEKMYYTVMGEIILKTAFRLIITIILAVIGLNVVGALVTYGLPEAFAIILLIYYLNSKMFSLKRPLRQARYEFKSILAFSAPIYLSKLLLTFKGQIQTVLVGALDSVTGVGIYTIASRFNLMGTMALSAITSATAPIFSELYTKNDLKQLGQIYQITTKWAFTFNLPIFLTMILFPEALMTIFGKSFVGGATALTILAWAAMVDAGTGLCGNILDMTGYTKLKFFNTFMQVISSIGLSFLLIPRWGIVGAATAALVSVCLVNGLRLLEVYILLKLQPYSLSFIKPVTASIVAAAIIGLGTSQWFPYQENLVVIIAQIIILFVVYGGIIFLLGVSNEDRLLLLRLRRRAGKAISKNK